MNLGCVAPVCVRAPVCVCVRTGGTRLGTLDLDFDGIGACVSTNYQPYLFIPVAFCFLGVD